MRINFCGKQIKEEENRSCGITQICDLTQDEVKYPNGLNSIYICPECLKKLNEKEKKNE